MIDEVISNYMSKLGKKGGRWKDERRKRIARLGGLARGQQRRKERDEKKSEKKC